MHAPFPDAVFAAWAHKDLPARLTVPQTARLLGFQPHDVPILVATGKLTPLGDPAPNAPKYFCALEVLSLAARRDWLSKATKEVSKYWHAKRQRNNPDGWTSRLTEQEIAA